MWKLTLTLDNGTTDDLYCSTRQEARDRAGFYRRNSMPDVEYPIGHKVVSSKITQWDSFHGGHR